MSLAAEHAAEAADTLRTASRIADPYKRADVIWEAVEGINAAAGRLRGRSAARSAELAHLLEESCEAGGEQPGEAELDGYAEALDRIAFNSQCRFTEPRAQSSLKLDNCDDGRTMSPEISVTLPDGVLEMLEARARATGKSKSEVLSDLLAEEGFITHEEIRERHARAMRLAAEAREGQTEPADAAELVREVRDEMESRLDWMEPDSHE